MDYESQRIIEALRSGVSSRAVGHYFSSARPEIMSHISRKLNKLGELGESSGMIISGKYGEGKTHLLNTVFNMAHENNMVVSQISLSKETPFDKLNLVYKKLLSNTYLPNRLQPGFRSVFQNMTPNSKEASDLLLFASKHLENDKLFFVLRSFLNVDDAEDRFLLMADLEGDYINNALLRQIYKRIFTQPAKFNVPFSKTKHSMDYFTLISHLFKLMGYNGWVLLFDEAELLGRLGKKARLTAYKNMAPFLFPEKYSHLESVFSIFALTSSFMEDVIEAKHDFDSISEAFVDKTSREPAEKVLKQIAEAPQLHPLTQDEILTVFQKVHEFHARAYDWNPEINVQTLLKLTSSRGYLLRTRIRAAVEQLDQIYQYGQTGDIQVKTLVQPKYSEEDIPSLEEYIITEDE